MERIFFASKCPIKQLWPQIGLLLEMLSGGLFESVVCSPMQFGGLRIHDLQRQSVALKIRWLWQNGTSPKKPWSGLSLPIDKEIKALFCASTTWIIGNGTSISFWNDHWLEGNSPANLYQNLFKHSKRRNLTLSDALQHRRWISLIKASPNEAVLREYVDLWRARNQLF